jgi:hypothetical protein
MREGAGSMRRTVKRLALYAFAGIAAVALAFGGLIVWPKPLFAFSLAAGRIVVSSDRPIPTAGGERVLRDCERLLERSPLVARSRQYQLFVANEEWHHRLYFIPRPQAGGLSYFYGFGGQSFLSGADFDAGQLVKWGYVTMPPRTLAYFCAHELTHVVTGEHIGLLALLRMPEWVREGIADYVAIEHRQSFEQLRDALGERPVDVAMMQAYGAYPRYRLLVTYFLEKKGWSVDELLQTKLSTDEALAIMGADAKR